MTAFAGLIRHDRNMNTTGQTGKDPSGRYSGAQDPADRLDSWKAVASYLGRSDKTVRRGEEKEGLPIHRLHHDKRGSIYAYKLELDGRRGIKPG